jgi:hypothetical protein
MIFPTGENAFMYWCPGCNLVHFVDSRWVLSGLPSAPTITPSILVQDARTGVCHSYVTEGVITFLADCDHELRSTAVPLPDFPDWMLSR